MKKLIMATALVALATSAQAAQVAHREVSVFDVEVNLPPGSVDASGKLDLSKVNIAVSPHQNSGYIYLTLTIFSKEGTASKNIAIGSCQIGRVPAKNWGSAPTAACMKLLGDAVSPKAKLQAVASIVYGDAPFQEETDAAVFPVSLTPFGVAVPAKRPTAAKAAAPKK